MLFWCVVMLGEIKLRNENIRAKWGIAFSEENMQEKHLWWFGRM